MGNEQLGNEQLGNEQLGNEQLVMNNWGLIWFWMGNECRLWMEQLGLE
jgi:hypothetical protein